MVTLSQARLQHASKAPSRTLALLVLLLGCGHATPAKASAGSQAPTPSSAAQSATLDGAAMAQTVRKLWPADPQHPQPWTYEMGTALDGMAAQWELTHRPEDLTYVRNTVDLWVNQQGQISMAPGKPFDPDAHTLDNLEPGRAILFCYRTPGALQQQQRYALAARYIAQQFNAQPRNEEGGFWHKQVYPNQMWLDGAYMAEPFRAEYAATFHDSSSFDDIAHQLLLMDQHMRDPATGLLHHGWDASHKEAWAMPATGLSQEVWSRALGWYVMALVDTLPWFPPNHPARTQLIAALQHAAQGIARHQDADGLWWDVLDKGGQPGNFHEASASAMFTYALAKGTRLGYLPSQYRDNALRGWAGLEHTFITHNQDGTLTLHGTVKVSGLGGHPYRSGNYAYYVHEPVVDNDLKGVGAYLLAASEMGRLQSN